jgi:hypothetical protein
MATLGRLSAMRNGTDDPYHASQFEPREHGDPEMYQRDTQCIRRKRRRIRAAFVPNQTRGSPDPVSRRRTARKMTFAPRKPLFLL